MSPKPYPRRRTNMARRARRIPGKRLTVQRHAQRAGVSDVTKPTEGAANAGPCPAQRCASFRLNEHKGKATTDAVTITLPSELEKQVEAAAKSRGVAVDAYARAVLEEAAKVDRQGLLAKIERIPAMTPPGAKTDSADILQQAREERYGR